MKKLFLLSFFTATLNMGCGEGGSSTGIIGAVLKGRTSAINFQSFSFIGGMDKITPNATVTLNNITGLADSLLVLTAEDYCGFSAWSANSQSGAVAIEDRTYESFNLGAPENWTSLGTGLRDGCSGGLIKSVEAYFSYVDLDVTANAISTKVRIAMGETGVYKAGDVLVEVSGVFNWIDNTGTTLTPVTSTRPSSPYQYISVKSFSPFKDGGSSSYTVLKKLGIAIDTASAAKSVSADTRKAVFNLDLSMHGVTATDTSSATMIAKTLSVPFLPETGSAPTTSLVASITPLTSAEIGGASDPAPTIGNSGKDVVDEE